MGMTPEEMDKAMQFILDSHAKFSSNIKELKANQQGTNIQLQLVAEVQMENSKQIQVLIENAVMLTEGISSLTDKVESLTDKVESLTDKVESLTDNVESLTGNVETMREETRYGFDNLILANEVTRELATQIGQLTLQLFQRVTNLDEANGTT